MAANAEGGGASGHIFEDVPNDPIDKAFHEQKLRDEKQYELLTKVDAAISASLEGASAQPVPGSSPRRRVSSLASSAPDSPQRRRANSPLRHVKDFPEPPPRWSSPEVVMDDVRQPTREISVVASAKDSVQSTRDELKLHAMHADVKAHAASLAKLDAQQAALAEQMTNLLETVNKLAKRLYSI